MYNHKEVEEEVKKFLVKENIQDKARNQNSKAGKSKKFYFMDGPPYATGHIHMGTALNKVLKDIALRSKRMQGFDVFDRPGYDVHGVPIEYQIEKELEVANDHLAQTLGYREEKNLVPLEPKIIQNNP